MSKSSPPPHLSELPSPQSGAEPAASGYLSSGRTNQKLRTRDTLVGVAADFIRAGRTVTVADVADAAQVSRATAYRYFPNSELLSAQAALFAAGSVEVREIERVARAPGAPADRLDAVIVASDALTSAHEAAYRALLQHSAEAGPRDGTLPKRPAFRRKWIEDALGDLKKELGPKRFPQLAGALSLLCGIESFVVLHDICQMPPEEALRTKRWAAQQLLRGALQDNGDARS